MHIFLLQTLTDFELVSISLVACAISFVVLYYIIRSAVKSATKEQNRILEEQNQILIMKNLDLKQDYYIFI